MFALLNVNKSSDKRIVIISDSVMDFHISIKKDGVNLGYANKLNTFVYINA